MTPELVALTLSGLLLAAQLALMAVRANLELGSSYFLSPRDTNPPQQPSTVTLRLKRAYENHLEALLLFAVAVTVITLAERQSGFTAACAFAYLAARALYVPAYALGWVPWRSVFYGIGFLATVLILIAALL